MSSENIVRELAAALREVVDETPEEYLQLNPEDAFVDLSCRLILRLSRASISISELEFDPAAARTFEILTDWLRRHPECFYYTKVTSSGGFEFNLMRNGDSTCFRGRSIQDTYAQAAQVLAFSEEHDCQS